MASNVLSTVVKSFMRHMGVLIVAALGLVGLQSAPASSQSQPVGYVKVVSGVVIILRDGREVPARLGEGVHQHDGLRTGADGHVGVTLKDDTRVSIGPDSEIRLSRFQFSPAEGRLELVLRMLRGSAAFVSGRIAGLRPEAMRIETPRTVVGIRGTHLAIRVEP